MVCRRATCSATECPQSGWPRFALPTKTRCSTLQTTCRARRPRRWLELATGGTPVPAMHATEGADPFAHPDAQRRFRVMANAEELERAFDYPWEKWTVFLHPAQRSIVERHYNGPARVAGSAGTGKTVVALHRAGHLVRDTS